MDTGDKGIAELVDLSGRCAVITGGSQGFGAAIARRMGEAGATVVTAARSLDKAQMVAASIPDGRGFAVRVDVTDHDSILALVGEAQQLTGRIDVFVNNAGAFSNYLLDEMPLEEFQRVINTNITGSFLCAQAAARPFPPSPIRASGPVATTGSWSRSTSRRTAGGRPPTGRIRSTS